MPSYPSGGQSSGIEGEQTHGILAQVPDNPTREQAHTGGDPDLLFLPEAFSVLDHSLTVTSFRFGQKFLLKETFHKIYKCFSYFLLVFNCF